MLATAENGIRKKGKPLSEDEGVRSPEMELFVLEVLDSIPEIVMKIFQGGTEKI